MTLTQLKYFCALVDSFHFSKTAKELFISQSTLSASISALEDDLSVVLLERDRRSVKLTEEGKAFYEKAKVIVSLADSLYREFTHIETKPADISIGLVPCLITPFSQNIFNHITAYLQSMNATPNYHIRRCKDSKQALERISSGNLTFAISAARGESESIEKTFLFSQKLVCYVGESHPLARKGSVRIDELLNEQFVFFKPSVDIRFFVDMLFEMHGIDRYSLKTVDDIVSNYLIAATYVATSNCVCIMPRFKEVESLYPVVPVELESCSLSRSIYIVHQKGKQLSSFEKIIFDYIVKEARAMRSDGI